jgi:hypothetical protein
MKNPGMRLVLMVIVALSLSGCALLYNDLKTPLPSLSIEGDTQGRTLIGKSSCESYLWMVALGDCSVESAMKNGGLTKVNHVDTEFKSFLLGAYIKFTTVVYGE